MYKYLIGRWLEHKVNMKYPKRKVIREMRFGEDVYKVDPRTLLIDRSDVLEEIVKWLNFERRGEKNWYIRAIKTWISENVEYTYDMVEWKRKNNWQHPEVTAQRKKWDCEDMSILLVSLAMCAGVPYYRLKLARWMVKNRDNTKSGHVWVLYLNDMWEWEIWEATGFSKTSKWLCKKLLWDSWYDEITYTVNKRWCFAQEDIQDRDVYENYLTEK